MNALEAGAGGAPPRMFEAARHTPTTAPATLEPATGCITYGSSYRTDHRSGE
jgi:hypothetical protein